MTLAPWTDEQLQRFLDEAAAGNPSTLPRAESQAMTLHRFPGGFPSYQPIYILELGYDDIHLTAEQAEKVKQWLQGVADFLQRQIPTARTPNTVQFAGFAKLLLADMFKVKGRAFIDFASFDEEDCAEYERLFALRAYDLACHIAGELIGGSNPDHLVRGLPDMKELPHHE